jgi:Cu/Ag efflux protein CusF
MKRTAIATLVFTLGTVLASTASAQGRHDDRPHGVAKPAEPSSAVESVPSTGGRHDERPHGVVRASGVGVVRGIDTAAKKIKLDHQSIKKFNLEAATHEFEVKSPKSLEGLKQGDSVKFVLEKAAGSGYTIIEIGKSAK